MIQVKSHYTIGTISSMADVRDIWGDDPRPTELNYMLGSTSGVHGSYATLDEIETCFNRTCACDPDDNFHDETMGFTVLMIHPRLVKLRYGHIEITRADIPYLRTIITRSMEEIKRSQSGNYIG